MKYPHFARDQHDPEKVRNLFSQLHVLTIPPPRIVIAYILNIKSLLFN